MNGVGITSSTSFLKFKNGKCTIKKMEHNKIQRHSWTIHWFTHTRECLHSQCQISSCVQRKYWIPDIKSFSAIGGVCKGERENAQECCFDNANNSTRGMIHCYQDMYLIFFMQV